MSVSSDNREIVFPALPLPNGGETVHKRKKGKKEMEDEKIERFRREHLGECWECFYLSRHEMSICRKCMKGTIIPKIKEERNG